VKVLHFSAHNGSTGGGIAAGRIHRGLLARGIQSRFCVAHPSTTLDQSFRPPRPFSLKIAQKVFRPIDDFIIRKSSFKYDADISTGFLGYNIAQIVHQEKPDVVHLHWLAENAFRISSLRGVNPPVVWRLNDMWAFCPLEQYQSDYRKYAGRSPFLNAGLGKFLRPEFWSWTNKRLSYRKIREMVIACPSHWIAAEASRSMLFSDREIVIVPTGCDTSAFTIKDRSICRRVLGLPDGAPVILVGADSLAIPRKGMDLFVRALAEVCQRNRCLTYGRPVLLSFGNDQVEIGQLKGLVEPIDFGRINNPRLLSSVYGASDVFVAPSRMENLANTVLESLACGTPVVAFSIGGMPDMIEHKKTGFLASPFDSAGLAEGIDWAISQRKSADVRAQARNKILREFSLDQEIDRYVALYEQLSARTGGSARKCSVPQ
jgi:glycosyltransferase involved in cell wall biosynthesis